jgi:hypothetical protein
VSEHEVCAQAIGERNRRITELESQLAAEKELSHSNTIAYGNALNDIAALEAEVRQWRILVNQDPEKRFDLSCVTSENEGGK